MEIDGCTRVTDILSWYQDLSKIPQDVLERKRDIGTAVHEAIEAHLYNEFYVVNDDMKGYMNSFLGWINSTNMAISMLEKRYFDYALKITGKIDCVMEIEGKLTIVDFKTSRKANLKIWKLQGGFYHMLCRNEYKDLGNRLIFLQLLPDGAVAREFNLEWTEELDSTCLSVLGAYRYFSEK